MNHSKLIGHAVGIICGIGIAWWWHGAKQVVSEASTSVSDSRQSQAPPATIVRKDLPVSERINIVLQDSELLTAGDYQSVLESTNMEDPEALYEAAIRQHTLSGLASLQSYFAQAPDMANITGKLAKLSCDPYWKTQLNSLVSEIWQRPEAKTNDAFWAFLIQNAGLNPGIKIKLEIMFEERAKANLQEATAYLSTHPDMAPFASKLYPIWARQAPNEAIAWLANQGQAISNKSTKEAVRGVVGGICQQSDVGKIVNLFQTVNQWPEGKDRDAVLRDILEKAIDKGDPAQWIPFVKTLPPDRRRDRLAMDLARKLQKAHQSPPAWEPWLREMGVLDPFNKARGLPR